MANATRLACRQARSRIPCGSVIAPCAPAFPGIGVRRSSSCAPVSPSWSPSWRGQRVPTTPTRSVDRPTGSAPRTPSSTAKKLRRCSSSTRSRAACIEPSTVPRPCVSASPSSKGARSPPVTVWLWPEPRRRTPSRLSLSGCGPCTSKVSLTRSRSSSARRHSTSSSMPSTASTAWRIMTSESSIRSRTRVGTCAPRCASSRGRRRSWRSWRPTPKLHARGSCARTTRRPSTSPHWAGRRCSTTARSSR